MEIYRSNKFTYIYLNDSLIMIKSLRCYFLMHICA